MREKNRNSIEKCRKKLPQFTTMNVIDGQAGLTSYSSLIFYSLTIDNILNIIVLLIIASISVIILTDDNGLVKKTQDAAILTNISTAKEIIQVKILEVQTNEDSERVGIPYTDDVPFGPINIWGYDTVFGDGWYKVTGNDFDNEISGEYIINYDNGYIINAQPFEHDGKMVYTTDNVRIKKIVSKGWNVYILRSDGSIWTTGSNLYGALGLGDEVDRNSFEQIRISNVKDIYAGVRNAFAIKENGDVYGWGKNNYGQLGVNDNENKLLPTKISINNIKNIYSFIDATYMITDDNRIYACGNESYMPDSIKDEQFDSKKLNELNIDSVKKIAIGDGFVIILKNDGTIYGLGSNQYGRLGLGDDGMVDEFTELPINNVVDIFASTSFSIVLKNDGTVWATGFNNRGDLGIGNSEEKHIFTQSNIEDVKYIKHNYGPVYAIKTNGEIYSWGSNDWGQGCQLNSEDTLTPTKIKYSNVNNISEIIPAGSTTYFLTNDNKLYGVGQNIYGQMGLGTNEEKILETIEIKFVK